eukprot:349702-Chlamydomonas_euryale.AAC.3
MATIFPSRSLHHAAVHNVQLKRQATHRAQLATVASSRRRQQRRRQRAVQTAKTPATSGVPLPRLLLPPRSPSLLLDGQTAFVRPGAEAPCRAITGAAHACLTVGALPAPERSPPAYRVRRECACPAERACRGVRRRRDAREQLRRVARCDSRRTRRAVGRQRGHERRRVIHVRVARRQRQVRARRRAAAVGRGRARAMRQRAWVRGRVAARGAVACGAHATVHAHRGGGDVDAATYAWGAAGGSAAAPVCKGCSSKAGAGDGGLRGCAGTAPHSVAIGAALETGVACQACGNSGGVATVAGRPVATAAARASVLPSCVASANAPASARASTAFEADGHAGDEGLPKPQRWRAPPLDGSPGEKRVAGHSALGPSLLWPPHAAAGCRQLAPSCGGCELSGHASPPQTAPAASAGGSPAAAPLRRLPRRRQRPLQHSAAGRACRAGTPAGPPARRATLPTLRPAASAPRLRRRAPRAAAAATPPPPRARTPSPRTPARAWGRHRSLRCCGAARTTHGRLPPWPPRMESASMERVQGMANQTARRWSRAVLLTAAATAPRSRHRQPCGCRHQSRSCRQEPRSCRHQP